MFPQIDAEKTTDSHRFFELIYRTFIAEGEFPIFINVLFNVFGKTTFIFFNAK